MESLVPAPSPQREAPAPPGTAAGPPAGLALARQLRRHLTGHGQPDVGIDVTALGLRDELSADLPPTGPGSIPVSFYGRLAVVGPRPTSVGTGAPCSRCLARRWQQVRPKSLREALETGGPTLAAGEPPYFTAFVAEALAALVLSCHAAGAEHPAPAAVRYPPVYLLDMQSLTVRRFRLMPDPECSRCGRRVPDTAEGARVELAASPKPDRATFRLRRLEDYDLQPEALANPVCGALGTDLINELDSPTTSGTLGCFTLRKGGYLHEVFWGGHANRFNDSARIGLLEGLERYAGMRPRGRTVQVVAPLESLGDGALDPRRCGLYSDSFYRHDQRVLPFSPARAIPWVWGYSLRDRRPILVPEIVTYYHTSELAQRFVQECSNGCASGGSLVEAIYHGLMELVERDAFLLTWYGRAALPEIDPQTSERAETRQLVDRLALYGYQARFFDARLSFPMPVVVAAAVRTDGGLGALCFGAGASIDPETALAAALAEIATDAPKLRRRTMRDQAELREMAADFGQVVSLHDHPRLYGLPEMTRYASFLLDGRAAKLARGMAELYRGGGPRGSSDLRDDLGHCVDAVTGSGFDVIVVEHTVPEQRDLGVHTASVIVPGLLPIDFGWWRQRARHMPRMRTALREAGLIDRDLSAESLNPAPHPFP
jgi:ribosomal protein S12 methylthiotransferase accessory factor